MILNQLHYYDRDLKIIRKNQQKSIANKIIVCLLLLIIMITRRGEKYELYVGEGNKGMELYRCSLGLSQVLASLAT